MCVCVRDSELVREYFYAHLFSKIEGKKKIQRSGQIKNKRGRRERESYRS